MSFTEKLLRARVRLTLKTPFYSAILCGLAIEEDRNAETAFATDGYKLIVNPNRASQWSADELAAVLAHEALHIAYGHHLRQADREHRRWNVACDYAINGILIHEGFSLPRCRLYDSRFAGMTAEEIYQQLRHADGANAWDMGAIMRAPKSSAEAEADLVTLLRHAANTVGAGNVPGHIRQMLEVGQGRLAWTELVRRWVMDVAKHDYTWLRPSRRGLAQGLIWPGQQADGIFLAVALDVSGSISDSLIVTFLGELQSLLNSEIVTGVTVAQCDTQIRHVQEFKPGERLQRMEIVGRGGTDFRPIFRWAEVLNPAGLIVFTDGEGQYPQAVPMFPLLWVISGDVSPPFGAIVRLP